ncbi:MAG: DNA recombination protein RmuC [Lentisphaerae bacterium]|nr:DNA recombination protein RmuC [Lentisphaerota bacterium]
MGFLAASLLGFRRSRRIETELARLQAEHDALAANRREQTNQFQVLANQILDTQSQKFTAQNREALANLLQPLGTKIADFHKRLEDVHTTDVQQRSALREQVDLLTRRSLEVGDKADALAEALRGNVKILGNWGEDILKRLLEANGYVEGQNYELQPSAEDPDGSRRAPDAVVYLPGNRWIIVDAKASLKDYADYFHATAAAERETALKAHIGSLETHYKGLRDRAYPELPKFRDSAPDFTIMFVPNEPALTVALNAKPTLYEEAVRANIIITGPSGLMAALRIVTMIWRQENQTRAVDKIFDDVRKIYEKYVGFAEDMQRIDDALKRAADAYAEAHKKLATGDGNLIRQMDRFVEEKYIKPRRSPPPAFLPDPDEDAAT